MFSQIPKKIAGQLAQYTPVAGLTMIIADGTNPAGAAQTDDTDDTRALAGLPRPADLGDDEACAEPLMARAAPAAVAPQQVVHEIIKQVPVPVPGPASPPKVIVQPERHDHYHQTVTQIDNHPTMVNTTVNQQINAGGDVSTSVDTNTVSGKGALGITGTGTGSATGSDGPASPAPEEALLDDDFGAGAKPSAGGAAGNDAGGDSHGAPGTASEANSDAGGPESAMPPGLVGPVPDATDGKEPPQPEPQLHDATPVNGEDPDGPADAPEDHLAQAVHDPSPRATADPLHHDLVGTPGDTLSQGIPAADLSHADDLGHTLDADHHLEDGNLDHSTDIDPTPDHHLIA